MLVEGIPQVYEKLSTVNRQSPGVDLATAEACNDRHLHAPVLVIGVVAVGSLCTFDEGRPVEGREAIMDTEVGVLLEPSSAADILYDAHRLHTLLPLQDRCFIPPSVQDMPSDSPTSVWKDEPHMLIMGGEEFVIHTMEELQVGLVIPIAVLNVLEGRQHQSHQRRAPSATKALTHRWIAEMMIEYAQVNLCSPNK